MGEEWEVVAEREKEGGGKERAGGGMREGEEGQVAAKKKRGHN